MRLLLPIIRHLELLNLVDPHDLLLMAVWLISWLNCWYPHDSTIILRLVLLQFFSGEALLHLIMKFDELGFIRIYYRKGSTFFFLRPKLLCSVELNVMLWYIEYLSLSIEIKFLRFISSKAFNSVPILFASVFNQLTWIQRTFVGVIFLKFRIAFSRRVFDIFEVLNSWV